MNDLTGHHVPTGSPLRHLILVVEVTASGGPLTQTEGPRIPVWCGVGDPAAGRCAGLPGTAYAKILEELRTEVSPTGAYWNQTRVLSDTRIPALGSELTRYGFASSTPETVQVSVTLLLQRAFIDPAELKGWGVRRRRHGTRNTRGHPPSALG